LLTTTADRAELAAIPILRQPLRRRDPHRDCSTNAIESLNARYRRAVRARGHFPTEQAAMKTLYLVTRSLDPKGTGQTRWAIRWKPALNAFAITFADRMPAAQDR
jgi:putative transposase